MSGGLVCHCRPRRIEVIQRLYHCSAFAGYQPTYSDYSSVVCLDCGAIWRTKAKYVGGAPDVPDDWINRTYPVPKKEGEN